MPNILHSLQPQEYNEWVKNFFANVKLRAKRDNCHESYEARTFKARPPYPFNPTKHNLRSYDRLCKSWTQKQDETKAMIAKTISHEIKAEVDKQLSRSGYKPAWDQASVKDIFERLGILAAKEALRIESAAKELAKLKEVKMTELTQELVDVEQLPEARPAGDNKSSATVKQLNERKEVGVRIMLADNEKLKAGNRAAKSKMQKGKQKESQVGSEEIMVKDESTNDGERSSAAYGDQKPPLLASLSKTSFYKWHTEFSEWVCAKNVSVDHLQWPLPADPGAAHMDRWEMEEQMLKEALRESLDMETQDKVQARLKDVSFLSITHGAWEMAFISDIFDCLNELADGDPGFADFTNDKNLQETPAKPQNERQQAQKLEDTDKLPDTDTHLENVAVPGTCSSDSSSDHDILTPSESTISDDGDLTIEGIVLSTVIDGAKVTILHPHDGSTSSKLSELRKLLNKPIGQIDNPLTAAKYEGPTSLETEASKDEKMLHKNMAGGCGSDAPSVLRGGLSYATGDIEQERASDSTFGHCPFCGAGRSKCSDGHCLETPTEKPGMAHRQPHVFSKPGQSFLGSRIAPRGERLQSSISSNMCHEDSVTVPELLTELIELGSSKLIDLTKVLERAVAIRKSLAAKGETVSDQMYAAVVKCALDRQIKQSV